jgi:hypothetical protein
VNSCRKDTIFPASNVKCLSTYILELPQEFYSVLQSALFYIKAVCQYHPHVTNHNFLTEITALANHKFGASLS